MNAYAGAQAQAQNSAADAPRPSTELEGAIGDLSHGLFAVECSVAEIARRVMPPTPEAVENVPAPGRTTYGVTLGNINTRIARLRELVSELSTRI